ncbi:chitinase [Nocardiopsis mwathae]|uniref:chitinase n=1 Tax=Nocardiopsis mwathae TaxID=1472723 RepID=A0A7W9YEW3_9ACTN|nr:glycoside hydrolase family 18 protein [Nocardiopsis mwathae]MBB6170905.1 chitinase [Nocardiopsis mwathae]
MSAQKPPSKARRRTALIGVITAVALGALFFSAFSVITDAGRGDGPARLERMAYFAEWNTANRDYLLKDVADSGAAERLTRIIWAFGDVDSDGRCSIPEDSDQPWELYQRRYDADESVDGQADSYEQPIAGSLHQLLLLREEYPDLRVGLSLGGWNWSTYFSDAVKDEESRREFVSSCIDLWLRGDLPRLGDEPQGGEGVAEGAFDGIDIDWEWPVSGGKEGNVERPEDRRNLTLVVEEFRRQMDELGAETGERYDLSVSVANGEEQIPASYEPEMFAKVDFVTVQGYDFTGAWSDVTDHHSQLYAPPGAPDDASTDRTVRQYLDYGLPADKLVLGFPAFGRGWTGVGPDDFGRYSQAEAGAEGSYGESTDPYGELKYRSGQRFFDPVNGAYWLYDGNEWWTYDTPEIVRMKGAYVRELNLGGLMMWNLDMDPEGDLVTAMDESLRRDG